MNTPTPAPRAAETVMAEEREYMRLLSRSWPYLVLSNGTTIAVEAADYIRDVPRLCDALDLAEATIAELRAIETVARAVADDATTTQNGLMDVRDHLIVALRGVLPAASGPSGAE